MKRTTLWLTEAQIERLVKLSKKTGLGISELIRRFIDEAIARMEGK
jgi:predicted DNA-binding protein